MMPAARILDSDGIDAVTELLNIGVGRAASTLSELIGERIELSVPSVRTCEAHERGSHLFQDQTAPETVITQAFDGIVEGRTSLCFSAASGIMLAKLLSGRSAGDQSELDSELSGILLEVGNIVLNGIMGSISNAMSAEMQYSLPELQTANRRGEQLTIDSVREDDVLTCHVQFRVAQQDIDGTIVVVCGLGGATRMLDSILQVPVA